MRFSGCEGSSAVHWSIKFPLIIVLATAILLLSYHTLVRFTWLGAWLNGRRKRPLLELSQPVS